VLLSFTLAVDKPSNIKEVLLAQILGSNQHICEVLTQQRVIQVQNLGVTLACIVRQCLSIDHEGGVVGPKLNEALVGIDINEFRVPQRKGPPIFAKDAVVIIFSVHAMM
jgi:hypothetical protein